MTQNAVKAFQRAVGIKVDGIAGPQTLLYLGLEAAARLGGGGGQFSSSDMYLLARVIGAEARGESYTGQVAVGAVILNSKAPHSPTQLAALFISRAHSAAFTTATGA